MAFSPDTVQTLLATHWTRSTPRDPPCPISIEKLSAIRSALHWVYQGVICYQCTFHPIVNSQWCIKLLESGQALKARHCGPLPPTHSHRHTSPAHFFFLSWPETQSGAWGKTWVLEGGEVRGLTCPQDTHIAVVLRLKKPSINAVLQQSTPHHILQLYSRYWENMSECLIDAPFFGLLHNISTSIGLYYQHKVHSQLDPYQ